jgi:hypothetical protein
MRLIPNRLIVGQPFFLECLKIVRVLSIVWSGFQIQSCFDSFFGERLADINLVSNQIANVKRQREPKE